MRITHVEAAVGPGESLSYVMRHKIFPNWHIVVADIGIWLTYAILLTATMAVFGLAWTRITRPSISDRVSTRSPRALSASSLPRG
jgi:ABC-type dipeptide/oligopeptide/nickel transport system permease subunit